MLVTKKAPDFTAAAVLGNNQIVNDFNLYKNIGEKGAVVFFYPMDFTFVCPSEIIAFDKRYDEFKSRGIEVIARGFDVLLEDAGVALRGSFLLDKDGTVRHAVINDLPLGRNIDEMIRMVDTMLFTNEHGEVCPAGWHKGDAGMKPSTEGVADYLSHNESKL